MSATTQNLVTSRREGCRTSLPAAAENLYEGAISFLNSSGYATGSAGSGANKVVGVNVAQCDNSGGSAGDLNVELWTEGAFSFAGSGFAITDVGKSAYALDNQTVQLSAIGASYIGRISRFISSTEVEVVVDVDDDGSETVQSVAATGSGQGDAAALTGAVNIVTAGDGTKAVLLPAEYPLGKPLLVYHSVATVGLPIFPNTGDDINDGTANAAVTIEGKTLATFVKIDGTTWAAQYTANT